jgi:PAS domain-containing protein
MNSPLNSENVLQVLHLQKLELEMQNHELCRAYAELDAARNNYVQLYDFAPVAFLTLSHDGQILTANHQSGNLLGIVRERLINTHKNNLASNIANYRSSATIAGLLQCRLIARTLQSLVLRFC